MVVVGRIDEAYAKHVDMLGKHHNMHVAAGLGALRRAMKDDQKANPGKTLEVQHVVGDGAYVAVHSALQTGGKEVATVHLFRFEGPRIVELWDLGQPVPDELPNSDGPF